MNATEQIQAAQKAELESMVRMADTAVHGFEKLAQLNLQILRETTQGVADLARAALSARDMQEWMTVEAANPVQAGSEKALAYAQRFAEIAGSAQAELTEAMNESVTQIQRVFRDGLGDSTRALPLGGEGAAALMENAMNFTAKAFEAMQKSQTQTAKMVTEKVQGLAQTSAKAMAARATPARKRPG